MKATEIVKALLKEKKMSMAALGRAIGTEAKGANGPTDMIAKRLKQTTITIEHVADMVDKMDYQVVVIPKGVTIRSDWYKVDGKQEG